MPVPYDKRANMIDGLPSTFNVLFVIKCGKRCELCNKRIKKEEISKNIILYTDEFEFVHKPCLTKKRIYYEHLRENDLNSPVKLLLHTGKAYKSRVNRKEAEDLDMEAEHPVVEESKKS